MDVSKLQLASASPDGVKMELYHPITEASFEPKVYLIVVGVDSAIYEAAQRDLLNQQRKKMQRKNRIRFELPTAEEDEQNTVDLLSKCVIGWENVEWEGKELPYSPENTRKLLSVRWVRDQVNDFIGDRSNFLLD